MDLRDKFAALGADDPDGWASSELTENIPQLARFRFLRGMWSIVDQHGPGPTYRNGEAARERLETLGASPDDLRAFGEPAGRLVQGLHEDLDPDR